MKKILVVTLALTGFSAASPSRTCPSDSKVPIWGTSRDLSTGETRTWACVDSNRRVFFIDGTPFGPRGKVFNVRAYGGKGDGLTDDTPSIRAAYDGARSVSNGEATVYFPPGRWRINSPLIVDRGIKILIDSGTLSASGPQAFRFIAGSQGAMLSGRNGQSVLRRADASNKWDVIVYIDSTSHITISELELDGNGSRAASISEHAHGIFVKSSADLFFKNLYLHDNQGDAIDLYGNAVDRIRAENIYVANLGRAGLDLTQLSGVGIAVNNFACVVGIRVSTAASLGECVHSEPAGGIVRTEDWNFTNLFLDGAGIGIASSTLGGVLKKVSIAWFKIRVRDANGISLAGVQDVSIANGTIISDDSGRTTNHVGVKITELDPVPRTGRMTLSHMNISGFKLTKRAGAVHFTSSATDRTTQNIAPSLVATHGAGGNLPDGTYSYLATSVIDGVETPSRSAQSVTIKNGGGRATITLSWQPIGSLFGSSPSMGYRIYGRQAGAEGLLATLRGGSVQSWTDDGSRMPLGTQPPRARAALGHVTLGPGVTIAGPTNGSGVFFSTVWPHTTITGDTISGSGDHCIASNSSLIYFEILNNECVDFGTVGIELSARENVPTAYGRISDNTIWNHATGGKIGIRLQNSPLVSDIQIENNDLRRNAKPLIVGPLARGIRLTNNSVGPSNSSQNR